jgi:hypothetical protein
LDDWQKVAEMVGTKTATQCKNYFANYRDRLPGQEKLPPGEAGAGRHREIWWYKPTFGQRDDLRMQKSGQIAHREEETQDAGRRALHADDDSSKCYWASIDDF